MQVLEVLVAKSPGSSSLGGGMSISPANSNRPARVLTHTVRDRRFVGDKIIDNCNWELGVTADRFAGGLVRVEIHGRQSVRSVARAVKRIIREHAESVYPTTSSRAD